MIQNLSHKDLESTLMDPHAIGVKEPVFTIVGDNDENITVLSSGKNGTEYNKTPGYFHTFPGIEIFNCLFGQGILLMQRNDTDGEAKEVKVVGLRTGVSIEVPSGWGQTIINTGKSFLVVADNSAANIKYHLDEMIKNKKGLAYYIVDKKGNISFEENPNYSFHPQISPY